jgi:microsomal dipeptidase-like Zn-dependent dipeptidase
VALVVDTHTHSTTMLPRVAAAAYHGVLRGRPPGVGLGDVREGGVDSVVAKAVGDPIVTRWHLRSPFQAVQNQLAAIRDETSRTGGRVVRSAADVRSAATDGVLAIVLGLEGADCMGTDLGLLSQLA